MTRKFDYRDALRHPTTRVRIGRRADGTSCEHPYEKGEPSGYLQWHAWAEKREKTYSQSQCPECGLWVIYERRRVAV